MPEDVVGRRGEAPVGPGDPGPRRYDPDATTAVPRVHSSADLLRTHEADVLREQLALQPGESAIVLTRGPGAGSLLRLGHDVISLGRSSTATVPLDDISVSRRHAEICVVPPGYRIVDLGSLNGTYVNDSLVEEALLSHGDDIRIGRFKLCFLTTVSGRPEAARPDGSRP